MAVRGGNGEYQDGADDTVMMPQLRQELERGLRFAHVMMMVTQDQGNEAVAYVQAQLIAARDAGAAVLLISDDLDEVLTLGDRVAVIHGGELTPALPALEWTRESIGLAMAGGEVHAVTSVGA